MSIKQDTTKIKFLKPETFEKKGDPHPNDLFIIILILLVACASFGLGRLSVTTTSQKEDFVAFESPEPAAAYTAIQTAAAKATEPLATTSDTKGTIVASKSGTKYHFPWCSGALRIKEENKVWFASEAEARAAGYEPASNCKGLK